MNISLCFNYHHLMDGSHHTLIHSQKAIIVTSVDDEGKNIFVNEKLSEAPYFFSFSRIFHRITSFSISEFQRAIILKSIRKYEMEISFRHLIDVHPRWAIYANKFRNRLHFLIFKFDFIAKRFKCWTQCFSTYWFYCGMQIAEFQIKKNTLTPLKTICCA